MADTCCSLDLKLGVCLIAGAIIIGGIHLLSDTNNGFDLKENIFALGLCLYEILVFFFFKD